MKVQTYAPTRAGLAGNPSDGYGGRAVALALTAFGARATIEPDTEIRISSEVGTVRFTSPERLAASDDRPENPHRLALACCRRFLTHALERGWLDALPPPSEGFRLAYASDIPRHVGLAGSSAIAVAVLRALAARYGAAIPEPELPGLALAVETEELGIHGGLMDRVAQVFGGLTYMDLSDEALGVDGRPLVQSLPPDNLPGLFIAWNDRLAAGSEEVHNPLRERVERGEPTALQLLAELAELADRARDVLLAGDGPGLVPIMTRNFELRSRLIDVGDGNRALVEAGRRVGAGVKQAGSGGAVVGAHDGDPARLARLRTAYGRIGARFVVPSVWSGPTVASTPGAEGLRDGPRRHSRSGESSGA
jgi:glucuronokinase